MRFAFTDDQLALRDAVRDLLAGECTPAVVRAGDADRVWSHLATAGVLGINVPERLGGLGLGPTEWVLLLEECGRFAAPVPWIGAVALLPLLVEAGADDLVRRVVSGDARVALGPADGFVPDADRAEWVVRSAPGEATRVGDPVCTAVKSVDPGRRLFAVSGTPQPIDGDAAALYDCAVLAASAELLGAARKLVELGVAYSKERHQFGRAIGSFQAVQRHLVDAHTEIEFAAPVVYRAAWALAAGDPRRSAYVAMAKAMASDAAQLAARASLQVHGAIGYTLECDLQLWLKRVFALVAAWGTAGDHRARVLEAIDG